MQYPVALIDMLNDRMRCSNPSPKAGMTMTLMLKPSSVKLHLVDFHRALFYERIDQYDLFIYTEDDIRISPKVVASYLHETKRVKSLVGPDRATDFNVGIVRYEYDFPGMLLLVCTYDMHKSFLTHLLATQTQRDTYIFAILDTRKCGHHRQNSTCKCECHESLLGTSGQTYL